MSVPSLRTLLGVVGAGVGLASALACLDPGAATRAEQAERRRAERAVESAQANTVSEPPRAAPPAPAPAAPSALDAWRALPADALVDGIAAEVVWEPYAGILRGPEGTAAARAGNAWDQALLVGTLLAGSGENVRYAMATLPDDAVTRLLGSLVVTPGDGGLAWDPAADGDLRERVRRHVWVEIERAGAWVPMDPLAARVGPNDGRGTVSYAPTLAEEDWQRLTLTVQQRTVAGDESTVGTIEGTVADLAVAPISLVAVGTPKVVAAAATPSGADPTGLGEGLDRALPGLGLGGRAPPAGKPGERQAIEIRRTLSGPGGSVALRPWTVRTTDAASGVAAEWLEITVHVPGEADRVVDRPLWEASEGSEAAWRRYTVGVFARAQGDPDVAAARAAVEAVGGPAGTDEAAVAAAESASGEAVGRFVVVAAAAAMDDVSDRMARESGVVVLRHQPRVYVSAVETWQRDGVATSEVSLDLGLDEVEALPVGRPPGAAALFQRGRGLAASSVEGEVMESLTDRPARTTARLTQVAAAEGIGLLVLDRAHADGVAAIDGLPESEAMRIREALGEGRHVVVPARAVPLDGRLTWGWWEVEPTTGSYVGVMEGGGHQAVLEYSIDMSDTLSEDRAYVMGLIVGAVGTQGLLATMAVKYEFAEITPEIAAEIVATLEAIICQVCPGASIGIQDSISVGTDCYTLGEYGQSAGASADISFCGAYAEGVKCAMSLALEGLAGQIPKVDSDVGGSVDIPFSCGGD